MSAGDQQGGHRKPPRGAGAGKHPTCQRGEARRRQVLEAAGTCFRNQGFHCASMAEISRRAGMSAGHIYHYFENKEDIINCIVQMDLEEALTEIGETEKLGGNLVDTIMAQLDTVVSEHLDPERAALMLEVLAEASRNPKVADKLQEADRRIRGRLLDLLQANRDSLPCNEQGDLEARVEMLLILFRGLLARSVDHPSLDRQATVCLMKQVIEQLFA